MRIRIERTYLTTASGLRVVEVQPDSRTVEAESLEAALTAFIVADGARMLGAVTEMDGRAVATAWKNRVYSVSAEPAPE